MTKIECSANKLFDILADRWFRLDRFIAHWIYPATHLYHLLFRRCDLVRLRGLSPYEYSDVMERMFHANMELVREFIEREDPENHVLWYGDDEITGPKWHPADHPMFPASKYDGAYIMDIIKEVHHWYTEVYPALLKQLNENLPLIETTPEGVLTLDWKRCKSSEELERNLREDMQWYLHLCIELRPYLWL